MLDTEIANIFNQEKTVRGVARRTGYSWNKIIKSLSTNGIIINDTHRKILSLYNAGMGREEIANQVHMSVRSVQCYLPRVRPVYGETISENAKRIKKCRLKKKDIKNI